MQSTVTWGLSMGSLGGIMDLPRALKKENLELQIKQRILNTFRKIKKKKSENRMVLEKYQNLTDNEDKFGALM